MNKVKEKSPGEYKVRLSDGNFYCFYPAPYYDAESLKKIVLIFKVRTVECVQDEDWKTAIAHHKEIIPASTELEVLDVFTNCYGRWLKVIYDNSYYYIDPSKVEYVDTIQRYEENE